MKISLKKEVEIKTFSDKQKCTKIINIRNTLQQLPKEGLQAEDPDDKKRLQPPAQSVNCWTCDNKWRKDSGEGGRCTWRWEEGERGAPQPPHRCQVQRKVWAQDGTFHLKSVSQWGGCHPPLQATDTSAQDHTKDLTRPGLSRACGPSRDCGVAWMHRCADLWEKPRWSSRPREKARDTATRSGL